ncbi:MAG: ribose-5-phosphate isomerase RpiA [Pseudomonadota bacterium]
MSAAIEQRRAAATVAAGLVEPSMVVGLGTGRTATLFIEALGARVKAESLTLPPAVPTSEAGAAAARAAGLAVADMMAADAPRHVDVAVDGADEVDDALRLIKGGGGSLLREKIVARIAQTFVVIVDAAKRVETLGRYPLPIEVVPFGWRATAAAIEKAAGVEPVVREVEGRPLISDNHNLILDCPLGSIPEPEALSQALHDIPGVVEHGLFLTEASTVLIGTPQGVDSIQRTG